MCLVVYKPSGADMPDQEYLENAFYNNSDGAGFMYQFSGCVRIRKGFMKIDLLLDALDSLSDKLTKDLVIHFRQATHGTVCPEQTHPFPLSRITRDLTALHIVCFRGMAHNGIIKIDHSVDESDTMAFVRKVLAYKVVYDHLESPAIKILLEKMVNGSKFAIMDSDGVKLIGNGWQIEDGVYYSNESYRTKWKFATAGNYTYRHNYWNDIVCPECKVRLIWDGPGMYFCPFCKREFMFDEDGDLIDIDRAERVELLCPECGKELIETNQANHFYCPGCIVLYNLEDLEDPDAERFTTE